MWILLLILAAAARSADARNVFVEDGVTLLVPTDSHYYVRFAHLQRLAFPRFAPFDPYINAPTGAAIIWPPLHTALVALVQGLAPAAPARAAAWVDPMLALVQLVGLSLLVRRWRGDAVALGALALLALTPAAVAAGALGNADHHVHEPFLAALCALLLGEALQRRSAVLGAATGAVLGLAPLLTPSGFVLWPGLAAALPAAAWLVRGREGPGVGRVGLALAAGTAGVLGLGVAVFGAPGSLAYHGLTAFAPLLALGLLCGASGVALLLEGRRGGWLALGLAVPCGVPLVSELARAWHHLRLGDPLLSLVMESTPLWKDPAFAGQLLGPVCVLLPVGLVATSARAWREKDPSVAPLVLGVLSLGAAALLQARFTQALMGCAALLIAVAGESLLRGPRAARVLAVALGLSGLPLLAGVRPHARASEPGPLARVRPTMTWLREHTPEPSPPWDTRVRPAWSVIAPYDMGHLLVLWAERPAQATPFSQVPVHQQANARAYAVLGATSEIDAYVLARASSARYLLLTPMDTVLGHPEAPLSATLAFWLREHAGLATDTWAASTHFRLVHDSAESRRQHPELPHARVFEVVTGAVLHGRCAPGAAVTATLELETGRGAVLRYEQRTLADAKGFFALRVAYPTVRDTRESDVLARDVYRVRCEGGGGPVRVSEEDVRDGRMVDVGG